MYETEGLKQGIEKAKENIKIFEDAIEKELKTIAEYKQMIEVLENEKVLLSLKGRQNADPGI